LESVDVGGSEEDMGVFGAATGHDEPSAGGCEDCWGGKGDVEDDVCMGHAGWQKSVTEGKT